VPPIWLPPSAKHGIPRPSGATIGEQFDDGVVAVVDYLDERLTPFEQGALQSRKPSDVNTPGVPGREYRTTEDPTTIGKDLGTSWGLYPLLNSTTGRLEEQHAPDTLNDQDVYTLDGSAGINIPVDSTRHRLLVLDYDLWGSVTATEPLLRPQGRSTSGCLRAFTAEWF